MTDNFNNFGLPEKLMQSLNRMGFNTPTPIQAQAIPFALQGKDILGSAQTGTGKTGAFGIPLVTKLMENPESSAIIMTPTRELATQVMAMLQQLIPVPNIKTALLIGGESMTKQFRQLQVRPRLIVGTPGRINDHLERRTLTLGDARFLVLDETDRMLDMGFGVQIDRILKHMPQKRQTMLFSATLPQEIIKMSTKYLNNPQRIAVGSTTTPSKAIKQELIKVADGDKYPQLLQQIEQRQGSIIVFVKTKHGADRMATKLVREGVRADALHGDLKQSRRDRVVQSFRDKKFRILIATDVAARGLDIPHIETVINYDMPQCPEDYIHRIGRTARAGAEGEAVNFLTSADAAKWRAIHKLINPDQKLEGFGGSEKSSAPQQKRSRPGGNRNGKWPRHRSDDRRDGRSEGNGGGQWRPKKASKTYAPDKGGERDRPQDGQAAPSRKKFGGKPFGSKKPFGKPFGAKKSFGSKKPFGQRRFADAA